MDDAREDDSDSCLENLYETSNKLPFIRSSLISLTLPLLLALSGQDNSKRSPLEKIRYLLNKGTKFSLICN